MQTTTSSGSSNSSAPSRDAMKDDASSGNAHGTDASFTEVASKAASDVASKAGQSVRGLVDESRAAANQRIDATSRWVDNVTSEYPVRTLGIAAAVGVVIGLLIGRR